MRQVPVRYANLGNVEIAYRRAGQGRPLLLLHGWPFSSLTFRKLWSLLTERYDCIAPDIPGTGLTRWGADTPFRFQDQAGTMLRFAGSLGIERFSVLAHDTGATLARLMALRAPAGRVGGLALLNTEIPGHRPPWIPLYGKLLRSGLVRSGMRQILGLGAFLRSPMGFGGCFWDAGRIDAEFRECFIEPLLASPGTLEGYGRYLAGFDWEAMDRLADDHARIPCPVALIWGEDDPTFPVGLAEKMATQFTDFRGFTRVPRARLLAHEERPESVAAAVHGLLEAI